ncbi:MAG: hypothetical protein E4G94_06755 [ANME-2 cluster archaeon]|nr:MAG: hypothetical protein E4G94_06755 [ANME-2 cluster archaeon]
MQKRKALLFSIIIGFYCIFGVMHGDAQNLLPVVEQYHNNTYQIADLELNKTRLEGNRTHLIASVTALEEQIQNSENNSTLLKSEIAALDKTIQENSTKKNTIERDLQRLSVLSKKVPTMFLGTITGMIAGLWVVSVFLVLLWRD